MNAVDDYIRLAEAWGVAFEEGDSETSNSLYEQIQEVFHRLSQSDAEQELFARADNASDAVCLFIASHLKDQDRARALALFKRLAHSPQPLIALSAENILAEMAAQ